MIWRLFPHEFAIKGRSGESSAVPSAPLETADDARATIPPSSASCTDNEAILLQLANHLWRSRKKMLLPDRSGPREEVRGAFRHLEAAIETLAKAGIEIVDLTGRRYHSGMGVRVIDAQVSEGLRESIIQETLKPVLLYQKELRQQADVIVLLAEEGNE